MSAAGTTVAYPSESAARNAVWTVGAATLEATYIGPEDQKFVPLAQRR